MNEELYFKDAFTEVDGNINIEANNISVNCLKSNNNKFSLDSDGNLVVNSITTSTSNSNIDFDMIYPVGSIYLSLVDTNPSILFGGVWEQIAKGRTLVGVDTSQIEFNAVKKEGGEKMHQLTIDEMPSHKHDTANPVGDGTGSTRGYYWRLDMANWGQVATTYNGGSQAHNNLQPYLTCYIWTRVF